jgi:hypothetical protein
VIAGIGFAMMAWELAKHRYPLGKLIDVGPASRRVCDYAEPWDLLTSREYYRILDDAQDSWDRLTTYAKRNWEPRYYL